MLKGPEEGYRINGPLMMNVKASRGMASDPWTFQVEAEAPISRPALLGTKD